MNKKIRETEHLTLKWGTLKEWGFTQDSKAHELAKKYFALGSSASTIAQHDTPEQKELLLQIIDAVDCKQIFLDWDGEYVSKKKAKEYVISYGK